MTASTKTQKTVTARTMAERTEIQNTRTERIPRAMAEMARTRGVGTTDMRR